MAMLTTLLLLSALFALGDARGSRGDRQDQHHHSDSEEHVSPPKGQHHHYGSEEHISPPKDRHHHSDSEEHISPPKDRHHHSDSEEYISPPKYRHDRSDSEEYISPPKGCHRRACPHGWPRYKTHCYHYVPLVTTWPEAERKCLLLGGHLASVHSLPQYRFLQSVIKKSTKKAQRTWIGANDAIKEGLWLWSDGSRFNYQNWAPGQPSNYNHGVVMDNTNGREHCMEMNYGASHRQNDVPCWFKLPFLCSRKR